MARAYATALFTVDWTRPTPSAERAAATSRWTTPAAATRLAHGQHYVPVGGDPRVGAAEVDTVEAVDVAAADPVSGARSLVATVYRRVRTNLAVTTDEQLLLVRVVPTPIGWLVDDSQVVG